MRNGAVHTARARAVAQALTVIVGDVPNRLLGIEHNL